MLMSVLTYILFVSIFLFVWLVGGIEQLKAIFVLLFHTGFCAGTSVKFCQQDLWSLTVDIKQT